MYVPQHLSVFITILHHLKQNYLSHILPILFNIENLNPKWKRILQKHINSKIPKLSLVGHLVRKWDAYLRIKLDSGKKKHLRLVTNTDKTRTTIKSAIRFMPISPHLDLLWYKFHPFVTFYNIIACCSNPIWKLLTKETYKRKVLKYLGTEKWNLRVGVYNISVGTKEDRNYNCKSI